ncbi:MAG TPA: hypothetical protein VGP82_10745, partial [Ktedonobacterales bacterium]|nr:hypothetical protein [Ktedonobacterales bacterium]
LQWTRVPNMQATPGLVMLEIDGLSEPVLQQALARGWMPTVQRWLASGSHQVLGWECDLSSQTSASQAGILLGTNSNVPAFRWYEKESGRIMVSNQPDMAAEIERRLSTGRGLLSSGGVSCANMFSGDASDSVLTFSTATRRQGHYSRHYMFFFASPFAVARTSVLFVGDVLRELYEAIRQVALDVRPRVQRGGVYPLVRAVATTLLREVTVHTVMAEMIRGVPVLYATFVGYDEVAHHSGVARLDALRTLHALDHQFALLERTARYAPRPYHFVILSDHGQSQGATFRQRYGMTLKNLVKQLIPVAQTVEDVPTAPESWGVVNSLLTEASLQNNVVGVAVRRALLNRLEDGSVMLGKEAQAQRRRVQTPQQEPQVVVLASGCLGLIYFTARKERLTYEQINAFYPRLISTLAQHEAIGFLLVHSETHGALAIGAKGVYYLDTNRVEGENPLAPFGNNAARHLRREDTFEHVPDIVVNAYYDADTTEVPAFEELVGSHGGLGGNQMKPFVIHPAEFDPGTEPIVGASQLHRLLQRWLTQLHTERAQATLVTGEVAHALPFDAEAG